MRWLRWELVACVIVRTTTLGIFHETLPCLRKLQVFVAFVALIAKKFAQVERLTALHESLTEPFLKPPMVTLVAPRDPPKTLTAKTQTLNSKP